MLIVYTWFTRNIFNPLSVVAIYMGKKNVVLSSPILFTSRIKFLFDNYYLTLFFHDISHLNHFPLSPDHFENIKAKRKTAHKFVLIIYRPSSNMGYSKFKENLVNTLEATFLS